MAEKEMFSVLGDDSRRISPRPKLEFSYEILQNLKKIKESSILLNFRNIKQQFLLQLAVTINLMMSMCNSTPPTIKLTLIEIKENK